MRNRRGYILKKQILLLVLISLCFIRLNVFADASNAVPGAPNYNDLKGLYDEYNSGNKFYNISSSDIITLYGKSVCSGTSCTYSYAGISSKNYEDALKKFVKCTNGEANINYSVGGSGKEDFVSDNTQNVDGTVYWGEEYQVTCTTENSGLEINNNVSSNSTTTKQPTTTTRVGNVSSNNEYDSSNTTDNPEQGVETYYIILGIIAFLSYIITVLVKKQNKFKNI